MTNMPTYDAPTTPLPSVDLVRLPSISTALAHRYQIKSELGRGGMGVVYLAQDQQLDRAVAIKVLHGGWTADPEQRQRLLAEAVTVARLDHPNIVRLYEAGECDGGSYLVFEYVHGETLRHRSLRFPFTPPQAATMVAALARAVQHAHTLGVIHRDLKPQNVIVHEDAEGGPAPKLTDFGIAKRMDADAGATATGVLLGTPMYMAPEQAAGRRAEVGPRSDVYGLGAILFELLTGRPPYLDGPPAEVALQVLVGTPPRPRAIRPSIPPELEAICLKCLEKSPDRRYQTALEVAEDLDRWSRGEVPTARPPRWFERVIRRVANQRVLLTGLLLALVATMFAALFAASRGSSDSSLRPLKGIERALSEGRAATLIGKTGLPVWHRWAAGATPLTTSLSYLDETTSFQPSDLALLELLPDPMTDRFRLSAEIRDDTPSKFFDATIPDDENRFVGVYCGHRHINFPDMGEVHRFVAFHFTDRMLPNEIRPGRPHNHRARVQVWTVPRLAGQSVEGTVFNQLGDVRFEPAKDAPRPWRTIRLEVSPTELAVYWDGEGGSVRFGRWTNAAVDRFFQQWPPITVPILADIPRPDVLRWNPRSPLGVLVRGTPVSVRNVVVEPLPNSEN